MWFEDWQTLQNSISVPLNIWTGGGQKVSKFRSFLSSNTFLSSSQRKPIRSKDRWEVNSLQCAMGLPQHLASLAVSLIHNKAMDRHLCRRLCWTQCCAILLCLILYKYPHMRAHGLRRFKCKASEQRKSVFNATYCFKVHGSYEWFDIRFPYNHTVIEPYNWFGQTSHSVHSSGFKDVATAQHCVPDPYKLTI